MLLLGTTINTLNEKGFNYRVNSEKEEVTVVFGFISQGQKIKVELIPGDEAVKANLTSAESKMDSSKELTSEGLVEFLSTIEEIKALVEKETALLSSLTERL